MAFGDDAGKSTAALDAQRCHDTNTAGTRCALTLGHRGVHQDTRGNNWFYGSSGDQDLTDILDEPGASPQLAPGEAERWLGEKPKTNVVRTDLLPPNALLAVAHHMGTSAAKYPDWDWLTHDPSYGWTTYIGALQRHVLKFQAGEDFDEDGYAHVTAIATNALMLLEMFLNDHPGDNRYKTRPPNAPQL